MWLKNELIEGLQKLLSLRLRNTPPADVIKGTVQVWLEVLESRPIQWSQELDTKRIRRAFTELCAISEAFPSPAEFLRVLGQREQPKALPEPQKNTMPEEYRQMINKMLDSLQVRHKL